MSERMLDVKGMLSGDVYVYLNNSSGKVYNLR